MAETEKELAARIAEAQRIWGIIDPDGGWRQKLIDANERCESLANLVNIISIHGRFETIVRKNDVDYAHCTDGTVWMKPCWTVLLTRTPDPYLGETRRVDADNNSASTCHL